MFKLKAAVTLCTVELKYESTLSTGVIILPGAINSSVNVLKLWHEYVTVNTEVWKKNVHTTVCWRCRLSPSFYNLLNCLILKHCIPTCRHMWLLLNIFLVEKFLQKLMLRGAVNSQKSTGSNPEILTSIFILTEVLTKLRIPTISAWIVNFAVFLFTVIGQWLVPLGLYRAWLQQMVQFKKVGRWRDGWCRVDLLD